MITEVLYSVFSVGILYTVYKIFYNPKKNVWKNQGIPEVPINFIQNLYAMYLKPLWEVQDEMYKKYGRIFGWFQFGKPVLMISDPELLKLIFVKDFDAFPSRTVIKTNDELFDNVLLMLEGEDWKRVRSVVSPTFSTGKMKKMSCLIDDCANSLLKNFESNQGKTINIKEYFGAYTMDVIAKCAFGITLDSLNDPNNSFVKHAKTVFQPKITLKVIFFFFMSQTLLKIFKISALPREPVEFFTNVTKKIMADRKFIKDKTHEDFLQLIIEASERDSSESTKALSDIEIIAQCFVFFVVGYETTTNALSFAAYNLALNQEVQKTLQKEVDSVVNKFGDNYTYETIMTLPYLDSVISETLRTHTNLIRLDRVCVRDFTLNNIHIPKGSVIGIPSASMHKDSEFFPEPEKFKPERFLPENKDQIKPYTYLPFGSGPRNCVAMRFALMEMKYALFNVVKNFDIFATEETKDGLKYNHLSTLLQPKEVPLKVVRR